MNFFWQLISVMKSSILCEEVTQSSYSNVPETPSQLIWLCWLPSKNNVFIIQTNIKLFLVSNLQRAATKHLSCAVRPGVVEIETQWQPTFEVWSIFIFYVGCNIVGEVSEATCNKITDVGEHFATIMKLIESFQLGELVW